MKRKVVSKITLWWYQRSLSSPFNLFPALVILSSLSIDLFRWRQFGVNSRLHTSFLLSGEVISCVRHKDSRDYVRQAVFIISIQRNLVCNLVTSTQSIKSHPFCNYNCTKIGKNLDSWINSVPWLPFSHLSIRKQSQNRHKLKIDARERHKSHREQIQEYSKYCTDSVTEKWINQVATVKTRLTWANERHVNLSVSVTWAPRRLGK